MAKNKKKKMKQYRGLILGLFIGIIFASGLMIGVKLSVNTSIVNQLQQYTQTTRTNDMFNPIIIHNNEGIMEIEVTLSNLNMIDNEFDSSDMLITLGRIENPITSVYDWTTRGQFLNDWLMSGDEYDSFCDSPDWTDTYWTHFYIAWDTEHTLAEGYTYILLVDFYDGDGDFHCCEDVWDWMYWFGEPPEWDLVLNVDPEVPSEDEMESWILNCDYVSFFEYVESSGDEGTTPPTDTTPSTDDNLGEQAGGWFSQYTIFKSIQNWLFLVLLFLILGILGLIIFILFFMKKDKKKGGKKK